jgi:hypothetical protein
LARSEPSEDDPGDVVEGGGIRRDQGRREEGGKVVKKGQGRKRTERGERRVEESQKKQKKEKDNLSVAIYR